MVFAIKSISRRPHPPGNRTPPSHGGDTGSKPVGTAKDVSGLRFSVILFSELRPGLDPVFWKTSKLFTRLNFRKSVKIINSQSKIVGLMTVEF